MVSRTCSQNIKYFNKFVPPYMAYNQNMTKCFVDNLEEDFLNEKNKKIKKFH